MYSLVWLILTYIHTHIHTRIHTYTHTYIHAYLHLWSKSTLSTTIPLHYPLTYIQCSTHITLTQTPATGSHRILFRLYKLFGKVIQFVWSQSDIFVAIASSTNESTHYWLQVLLYCIVSYRIVSYRIVSYRIVDIRQHKLPVFNDYRTILFVMETWVCLARPHLCSAQPGAGDTCRSIGKFSHLRLHRSHTLADNYSTVIQELL